MRISLGGIAKGYAVDRAAKVLEDAGLTSFFVQAGGDLYARGQEARRRPSGKPACAIRAAPTARYFAMLPVSDHAFSTAGDYERSFVIDGKRYHHIIDPRTGYPATASRSVTIWAPTAFLADAIDDAVFILGPEKGLALVESLDDVGAVIVDAHNKVWVSKRLQGRVQVLREPTDAPVHAVGQSPSAITLQPSYPALAGASPPSNASRSSLPCFALRDAFAARIDWRCASPPPLARSMPRSVEVLRVGFDADRARARVRSEKGAPLRVRFALGRDVPAGVSPRREAFGVRSGRPERFHRGRFAFPRRALPSSSPPGRMPRGPVANSALPPGNSGVPGSKHIEMARAIGPIPGCQPTVECSHARFEESRRPADPGASISRQAQAADTRTPSTRTHRARSSA